VVTVTITGANDTAVISGTTTGAALEAGGVNNATVGTPTATGTLTSTDVDGTANAFTAVSTATATTNGYGTYVMTAAGAWTFTLDNTKASVQALTAGQEVSDTFTVTAADGTPQVVTVTITGANDTAVISGTTTGVLTEDATPNTTSGTLTVTDVDTGQAVFQTPTSLAGTYGTYTLDTSTGAWGYTLDNTKTSVQALVAGQQVTDTLLVKSQDDTASQNVVVTVTGVNDAPVIVTSANALTTLEDTATTFVISSQLAGKVTDAEGTALKGIVIVQSLFTAANPTEPTGTWAYSTDGTTWVDFPTTYLGTVDWTQVMYLNASDSLRFTPFANTNGASLADLNFRAVDATFPNTASGTKVNVTGNIGGTGAVSNQPGHFTVSVTDVNDAPTLTATGISPTVTSNAAASVFSTASANTGNSFESAQTFNTLVITVDGLQDGANEKLTIDGTAINLTDGTSTPASSNGWTASVSVVSGKATVTLSNSAGATATALDTLVNGIQYNNSQAAFTNGTRVVTITSVQDNGGTTNGGVDTTSLSLVSTIVVVGNAAPVNTVPDTSVTPLAVTEDTARAITGLSVADDGQGSTSYTVTLTATNGVLNVSGGTAAIAGTGTSTVTLTGTLAAINATLAATVSYVPTANYNGAAKITMVSNDNASIGAKTDTDDINLTVNAVNDAPVLTPGAASSYTEQAAATAVNSTLTVSDVDSNNLTGATVTLDPATFKTTDVLAFTNANGITGSYNSATGVMTLSGTATVAQYQAALQSVTFNNSSDAPGTTRTLKWTVTDDLNATSTIGSSVINITPVNDAPLMTDSDGLATNPLGATGTTATTSGALDGHTATQTFGLTTVTVTGNLGTVYAGTVFLNDGGGSTESVNMAFSLPVSKITATWQGVNSGDNLQIKINGQFLTLTTAMISGASLSADKLTAIGTSATYTMTINAADVPGGVINSITLVAPGNFGAGGFYSSNFTVTESLYTAAQTVASMFGGVYSDVDPDAMKGVVITSAGQGTDSTTLGTYVYSSDNGVTWNTLASGLTDSTSVFLKNTDQIRFIRSTANGSSTNKPDLIARLVDTSGVDGTGSLTSGTVVDVSGTKHGGSTAFSDNAITLKDLNLQPASPASVTVTGLEDAAAPVGAVGTSIASLVELSGMDPEGVAVGLAFVAQISSTANTFYYSLNNGATWVAAPTTAYTTSNALILPSTALVYIKGAANFNGALATTSVRLWDGTDGATAGATKNISTLTGANGAYSATNTALNLVVTAVNDTPVNTVPVAQTATEDTAKVISGLSITDVDAGTATNMSVTLSVTNGTITMLPGAGTVTLTNNGTSSVTLTGTLANINTLLALSNAVTYRGNLNFNGTDTLNMLTSDNGNTGTGGTLTDSDNVTITVSAVNDGPVNTVPAAQSTAEDTPLVISGLQMADVDSTTGMSVTLAVTNGTINVLTGTGVTITTNGTASVVLAGTQASINALLATANAVTYTPTANYSGAALLTMTTSDGNVAVNDVDTVAITVTSVNDAPVLATTSTITYVENAAAAIINNLIVPTDVDNTTFASAKVSITAGFEANKDVLSFTNASMGNIAGSYDAASGVMTLTSAGSTATLAQWQAALRAVRFNSTTDNPVAPRTVSYVLNDGTSDSNAITSTISFTAVNDAPVNTVPAAQSAGVGTVTAITGLSIADADANSGSMTVTLSLPTGAGVINVSGGSATIASGNGTNSVVLTGTVADINSTLASSVTYTLASSAPASTTLTMLTSDNGNTGGAALTDSDQVTIAAQKIEISNVQVTQSSTGPMSDPFSSATNAAQVIALSTSLFNITTSGASFTGGTNRVNLSSTFYDTSTTGSTGALMVDSDSSGPYTIPQSSWVQFALKTGSMTGSLSLYVGYLNVNKTVEFFDALGNKIGSSQTLAQTGQASALRTFTIPTGANPVTTVKISGQPDTYWIDDLSYTGDIVTTTTINNALTTTTGTSTSVTPTTINGTLAVALGANEVVEVFRNGVSIGNATVTGTTWTKVDSTLNTVQTDLYEARVKNTVTSSVVTESNDYAINPGTMTAAISMSDTTLLVGETSTVTFTFSEAPLASSFVLGDITAPNGTVTNLVQTSDPKVWTALYTPTANLQSVSGNLISLAANSYTGLTGSVGQAASSAAFVVDTQPPVATLSVGNVTMDNVVSSTDSTGQVLVTGKVTGEFVAGDVVTLNVNGTPYSGTVNASGSYGINVAGTDLAADADKTIGATLLARDINGNTTTVPATKTYLYSAVVPTITNMVAVKDSYSTQLDDWNSATQIDAFTVKSNLWTITTTSGSLGRPTLTVSNASTAIWGAGATNKFLTVSEMGTTSGASSTANNTGATIKFVPNTGAGSLYSLIFDYVQLMSSASVTYYDENNNVIPVNNSALNASVVNTTSQSYGIFTPYLKYASYFVLSNFGNEIFYLANGSATIYTGTKTPVIDGASANLSSTIVNGTLSTTLGTNEVLEVFRNGVSVGNATVTGTTWTVVDRDASSVLPNVYTARVKNTSTSTYLNSSNVFSINPAPTLAITDNSATDVVASSSSVTYSFTFDQPVTGFDTNDVTVTNGTKGAFTKINDSLYTLVVTEPAGSGTTQVVVANSSYTAVVNGFAGVPGTGAVGLQDYGVAGSAVAKTLTGTTSAETLLGSELADNITGAGGADKIYTGAGDDTVILNAANITSLGTSGSGSLVDGGSGTNIFKLSGAGITLDLTLATVSSNLRNFSSVDLTGSGNNTLKLNLEDVLSLSGAVDNAISTGADESKMLVINGDAGDVLQLVSGSQWTQTGSGLSGATLGGSMAADAFGSSYGFVAGDTYARYTYGGATLFVDESVTLTNL
jgi:VCBS repeat-containing protein